MALDLNFDSSFDQNDLLSGFDKPLFEPWNDDSQDISLRSNSMQSLTSTPMLPKFEVAAQESFDATTTWIRSMSANAGIDWTKLPPGFANAVISAAQKSTTDKFLEDDSDDEWPAQSGENVDGNVDNLPALLKDTTTEELIVRLLGDETLDTPSDSSPFDMENQNIMETMHDDDYDSEEETKRGKKRKTKELEPIEELEAQLRNPNLSSKERRQLRNKISARNFRERRKEYISVLEGQVRAAREGEAQAKDSLRKAELENRRLRQVVDILKTAVLNREKPKAVVNVPPPASKQEILKKTNQSNAGAFDPFGRGVIGQVGVHTVLVPPVAIRTETDDIAALAEVVAQAQSMEQDVWDCGEWELDSSDQVDELVERWNLQPWLKDPKFL